MKKTITLHPSRIGCPSIPGTMKGMVMSIPGVEQAKVRYEDRALDITFDDEKTSTDVMIEKIGKEMGLAMEVGESGGSKDGAATETCPM